MVGGPTAASRVGSDGRPDPERAVGGGESASGTEVRVEQLGRPRRSQTSGGRLEGAGGDRLCADADGGAQGGVRAERGARGRSGRVRVARAVRRRRSVAREIGEPGAVAGGRFSRGWRGGRPWRFSGSRPEGDEAFSRGRRTGVQFPVTRRFQPDSGRKVGKARPRAGGTGPRAWAAWSSTLRAPQA